MGDFIKFGLGYMLGTKGGREFLYSLGDIVQTELKKTPLFNLTKKEKENDGNESRNGEKDNVRSENCDVVETQTSV